MTAFLRRTRRGAHWLFVGRISPNKCHHDVLAAFAVYRRHHDPGARLTLVGSPAIHSYWEALLALADDLGLGPSVTFLTRADDAELAACYEDADVFVCLSEHEGFCVPILEAMAHGTPVVAYAAAAVPDTVGRAGVLLSDKDPALVASAVHRLLSDEGHRAKLTAAGFGRVLASSIESTSARFVTALESVLEREPTHA